MSKRELKEEIKKLKKENRELFEKSNDDADMKMRYLHTAAEYKEEKERLELECAQLKGAIAESEHLRRALEDARKSVDWYRSEYFNAICQREEFKDKLKRSKLKWISVEQDKPGVNSDIIGYIDGLVVVFYGSMLPKGYMESVVERITHWMPLSALPTVDGKFVREFKKINLSELGVTPQDFEPVKFIPSDPLNEVSGDANDRDETRAECES